MIFVFTFLLYIWFTLQYVDDNIYPLMSQSIQLMSSSSFDDTISRLSPHFAKFEQNCKNEYQNYTLDAWQYISSVLTMDWTFRLIYLFLFYKIAAYLENKYQCKFKKYISNNCITSSHQQTFKYKLFKRFLMLIFNTFIIFNLYMIDVQYTRWRFTTNDSQDLDPALMDYSNISFLQRLKDFVYIFVRVHPTHSWLVRLSHGIAYPFTLFALTRPNISGFLKVHMLTIMFWAFHIGGLAHTLDNDDMQLRCVRRSFIWSNRGTSTYGEALRLTFAPYLNLVCLTIDCTKLVL